MFDIDSAREYAEKLYRENEILCHGAAIAVRGKAYIFFAPSGTGKTTHIKLWAQEFADEFQIINDDKPIIRLEENGDITVRSSILVGKENLKDDSLELPLAGVCLLKRGESNSITKVEARQHLAEIFNQVYRPDNAMAMGRTLELIDGIFNRVDMYEMFCTVDAQAAHVAYEAMVR